MACLQGAIICIILHSLAKTLRSKLRECRIRKPEARRKLAVCLIVLLRNTAEYKIQLVVGFGPGPHWQGPGLADLPGYSVLVEDDGWPVCA
jgi:hypothetical protein